MPSAIGIGDPPQNSGFLTRLAPHELIALRSDLTPFEALTALEDRLEVRPSDLIHLLERVQISGGHLAWMFSKQQIHRRPEFGVIHRARQVIDDAIRVSDLQGVEEIAKHIFVLLE